MGSAVWWLIAAAVVIVSTEEALEGPGVCLWVETYTTTKVPEISDYEIIYQGTVHTAASFDLVDAVLNPDKGRTLIRTGVECCKGYTKATSGDRCIPVCSEDCGRHATCVAPGVCQCEEGYGGMPKCDRKCPLGKSALECELHFLANDAIEEFRKKNERDNANTCRLVGDKCICFEGWTGAYCHQKCPSNRYGQDCAEECRCKNGGSCHHISGECHCAPGYTGPLCDDFDRRYTDEL